MIPSFDATDHTPRVLIVDDERHNRQLLEGMLGPEGLHLVTAASGEEALAIVAQHAPDLVLLDIMMPGIDGYEVSRRLKGNPATKNIPVIMVTALDDRNARMLGLNAGAEEFLSKPVDRAELCVRVRNLLRLKAYADYHDRYSQLLEDEVGARTADLIESERIYRTTFDAAPVGIVHVALDGRWVRVNQWVCDLLGYTADQLEGVSAQDLIPPEEAAAEAESLRQMAAGTRDRRLVDERQFRRQDGSLVWAAVTTSVHRDAQGCALHFITVIKDITGRRALDAQLRQEIVERKQAESSVRLERDRAERYLDTAGVIMLAVDLNERITMINRHGCAVLGWPAAELLGRDWIETCIPVRLRDGIRQKIQNVIGGDVSFGESAVLTRSGEERLIEWRNSMLRDEAGQIVGAITSGTDITDRNRAVDALRTAEERMRFALESANVGIWDMDYATGALRWSPVLESQHGLQPGTFGGTFEAFIACMHEEDRESAIGTLGKAITSGADFTMQHRALWPDGTVRWLNGSGRIVLGQHGEPVRGVGISLDVTERRNLGEQYRQAQKMEAVGRLAGGVAHDFNNLLTVILGYCGLLLEDLDSGDPRQPDIAEIQKAGTRGAALTRQLLSFSRKQIIQPTLLDMNVVVADMRPMLARLIGEDVTVVLRLSPEAAPVKADQGQVEQIVLNLAVNARDAMPKGGTLTIEIANVDLDEDYPKTHFAVQPGPYVALAVADTGTGITPQVQARLFEPFFTTKEVGKGTGLGLATVHGIVMRSGGSITVDSEVGRGTAFKLYFPRVDAAEAVVDAPPVARPHVGAQTVLLVEDEEGLRELASRLLQRQGYTVLTAANTAEALHLFEQNPAIDVLLTDVVMPGGSGPELSRQLLAWRPALRVIYMSGYTDQDIVQHGVLNPGIAFLHKPFTAETLGAKIREVLDR